MSRRKESPEVMSQNRKDKHMRVSGTVPSEWMNILEESLGIRDRLDVER